MSIVWAYDHQSPVDLRGICNELKLPCPKCGETGNFDGWCGKNAYDKLKEIGERGGFAIYDDWSAMKYIAICNKLAWEPSPNNSWFHRPNQEEEDYSHLMKGIKYQIEAYKPHP